MRGPISAPSTTTNSCTSALAYPPSSQVSNILTYLTYTQHPCPCLFLVVLPPVPISLLVCPRHLVPKALVLLLEAPCSPSLLAHPCPKMKVVEQTQQHLPIPLVAEGMRVKRKLTGKAGGWTEERKKQQVSQDMCPKSYR